jgi:hypothetical protein
MSGPAANAIPSIGDAKAKGHVFGIKVGIKGARLKLNFAVL